MLKIIGASLLLVAIPAAIVIITEILWQIGGFDDE